MEALFKSEKIEMECYETSKDKNTETQNETLVIMARKNIANEAKDDDGYYHGIKLILITVALMIAVFLMGLDTTILATAIPHISTQFDALHQIGWFGSSYLLCNVALQPIFGRIYSVLDLKKVFLISVIIFEIGSVLCATAENAIVFIIGRSIAGAGASGILSGGMIIISFAVALQHRAAYFAILSSMNGLAGLIGPPLGGFFVDTPRLTWRFCFWINLPFGALSILTIIFFYKSPNRPVTKLTWSESLSQFDIPGFILFMGSIICLLLALEWGGIMFSWSDSQVWGCLLGFVLLLCVFIKWQLYKKENALIRPAILCDTSIASSCIYGFMMCMGLSIHTYYLPFYFQSAKGLSAESSGSHIITYLIVYCVVSIGTGFLVSRFGIYGPFMALGAAIFSIGSGLIFTLQVNSGTGIWVGYQFITALGLGGTIPLAAVSVLAMLSEEDIAIGNVIIIFANNLGMAVALSVAQNIFSTFLIRRLTHNLPEYDIATIIAAGATNITSAVPANLVDKVREAYDYGLTRAFALCIVAGGVAFFCSFFINWKNLKGKKNSDDGKRMEA